MQGFIKKVFIADSIEPLVSHAFSLAHPTTADAWLGALAYTVQLYFDFSGYSDMALGLGLMMGFRFFETFNQPYISQSITELWRRRTEERGVGQARVRPCRSRWSPY